MTKDCRMTHKEGRLVRDSSSDLPEELIDEVVSRLPPTDIYKMKCVRKSFCSSAKEDHLRSLWARRNKVGASEPERPFLLCSSNGDDVNRIFLNQVSSSELPSLPCGDKSLMSLRVPASKWRRFPAPFLLPSVQSAPLKLISSAPGLVLTAQDLVERETVCVINPLTRSKRKILPLPEVGYRVRQLVMDDVVDGRYIIFAEDIKISPTVDLKLLLYDSMTEQWRMNGTLRTFIRCPLIFTGAASLHGTFYCLAITQETAHLFQFDMVEGWRDSDARVPPSLYPQKYSGFRVQKPGSTVSKPHLFRYRIHLMLAGVTLYKYGTKSRWEDMQYNWPDVDHVHEEGVHLWKLDDKKRMWKYERTMPEHMFNKNATTYEFLSCENYLLVNEVMPKVPKESSRRFFCELSTGQWCELPLLQAWDPSSNFKTSAAFTCICTDNGLLVYEPRIDAKC